MVDTKYPKRYIPKTLSDSDKKKQKKQLNKSTSDYKKGIYTERKKLESFKGEGAYYSSGSRPNQSPQSWGIGRYSSVLLGGPARRIDKLIVDKYNIPKI